MKIYIVSGDRGSSAIFFVNKENAEKAYCHFAPTASSLAHLDIVDTVDEISQDNIEDSKTNNQQPHTAICPVTAMQCDHAEIVVKCKSAPGTCGYQDKQQ